MQQKGAQVDKVSREALITFFEGRRQEMLKLKRKARFANYNAYAKGIVQGGINAYNYLINKLNEDNLKGGG